MTVHHTNLAENVGRMHIAANRYLHGRKLEEPRKGVYCAFFKRVLDISLILASAPIILPTIAILALLVAMDGHSPFYSQRRIGRKGRTFTLWKLRTMVANADEKLAAYLAQNPEARKEWETIQKLKNDPRITRFGRLLRKTSLDELPQLWNVLKGDMSLVGPRPMLEEQRHRYPGRSYYALRPGITGLWQISTRNEGSFAGRAKYDTQYMHCVSLKTDLGILLRTVRVVLRGTGY